MTEHPEAGQGPGEERTVWMRRYTLDPALADDFVEFLRTRVFPARQQLGFTVESVWMDADKSQLTWFVSRSGDADEFAAAEQQWEDSQLRAEIFTDAPAYVTGKDLRRVTQLR